MKKRKWKKIVLRSMGVLAGLLVILMAHIWWVTRPHIDAGTRVMARIDLHQRIGQVDADRVKAWLYKQDGVKYVLVNPVAGIVVFSFAPLQNDGNRIAREFKTQRGYDRAERYLPAVGRAGTVLYSVEGEVVQR